MAQDLLDTEPGASCYHSTMDLLDDSSSPPPPPNPPREPFMRRFRKLFILVGAALLALGLSIRHRGQDLSVEANAPLRAAVRSPGDSYDLGQLPIFSRTLKYVQSNYFDKSRLNPRKMLVGALDYLQRDVPEILVDRSPEVDPTTVTVKVNGQQQAFSIESVDSPWRLHAVLKEILKFIQPRLQAGPPKDEPRRLVDIEVAATNGMLYTLDPHSLLLDVDSFKEMRTQTQGKFGGLGIVIEMDRKGRISVKRPMPETPAMRIGIKAKDHIVRINNEGTVNMTLQEAVDRLRGDPGTNVDVYVDRTGQSGSKKFTITRDFIRPPAIDPPAQVLVVPGSNPPAKVGYFRILSFSANTERDVVEAMNRFEQEKVKGVIMDLRNNPGGLYDQAQKVCDAFVDSGVLVSMVGVGGSQRKDDSATRGGNTKVPLAVLVNQNSASASEIVAGAMKNLDRGVVIGETTFGKGSVQMLFDVPAPIPLGRTEGKNNTTLGEDDRLGLKLTTAQYLTPGDLSIQGVGVTPDVELVQTYVQKVRDELRIRLQKSPRRRQEADLEMHLDHPSARRGAPPSETVPYLWIPTAAYEKRLAAATAEDDDDGATPAEDDDEDTTADLENPVDYTVEFARDLLAQAKTPRRRDLLAASKAFFDRSRVDEDKKLQVALEKLGVDWSPGPTNPGTGQVQVQLSAASGEGRVAAGGTVKLRGTVKNTGKTPVFRLHAILKSENTLFDENEMVFGKLAPGETKTYDLSVKVGKATWTRMDSIRANLLATGPLQTTDAELKLQIDGKARPLFAYNYQTVDDVSGNGDGQVQKGEKVRLLVTVKNIGAGAAIKTDAILRNGAGQEGILISHGRFDTKDLAAGATKTFSFIYEVSKDFQGADYQLELMVGDTVLGESVTDKIKIKVAGSGAAPEGATGAATVKNANVLLREAANPAALAVGKVAKGAAFKIIGKQAGFLKVEIEAGHPAFLAAADVDQTGSPKPVFQPLWQVTPPILTAVAPTSVTGNSVTVKGQATDDNQVKDLFIRVYNRDSKLPAKKVFYLSNRGDKTRLPFETKVPLWPGSNIIQIIARENNDVQTVSTLVVLQKPGPAGPATPTLAPAELDTKKPSGGRGFGAPISGVKL